MRLANILQLGVKELRGLARDPMLVVLILYAFTLSIYTASTSMPETLNKAAIAVVDEDQSPVSSRILTAFYPPYFSIPKIISQHEMDSRMDAGLDTFALDIPRISSVICLPVERRRSSSMSTPPACRRPSAAAAISSPSFPAKSTSISTATVEPPRFLWISLCVLASTGAQQGLVRRHFQCDLIDHDAFDRAHGRGAHT